MLCILCCAYFFKKVFLNFFVLIEILDFCSDFLHFFLGKHTIKKSVVFTTKTGGGGPANY